MTLLVVKKEIEILFEWPGNSKEIVKIAPKGVDAFVKSRLPRSSANIIIIIIIVIIITVITINHHKLK